MNVHVSPAAITKQARRLAETPNLDAPAEVIELNPPLARAPIDILDLEDAFTDLEQMALIAQFTVGELVEEGGLTSPIVDRAQFAVSHVREMVQAFRDKFDL